MTFMPKIKLPRPMCKIINRHIDQCAFYSGLRSIHWGLFRADRKFTLYRPNRPNPSHTYNIKGLSVKQTNCFSSYSFSNAAELIKENSKILAVVGAGLSTPSGIPDFRSPGTGLYDNLQKFNLPYPEAIFDINYFMMDSRPFFTLAKDLYPGVNYQPSIGHFFLRLLNDDNKLLKLYTQNIDGLESIVGIPNEKLVEAHGTFSSATCTLCRKVHNPEILKSCIMKDETPVLCNINNCKGKVKPNIVFFGENLPDNFWKYKQDAEDADLLLVIGTSLEVYPFANIPDAVNLNVPRILINKECVGTFGNRSKDFILTGELTSTIHKLSEILDWSEKLKLIATKNKF